ncbi:RNA helicase [Mycena rebaudengoi]|nr:RNA helicase [Mycena rebaudengoi]
MSVPLNPTYCSDFVNFGRCDKHDCRLNHQFQKCPCGVVLLLAQLAQHQAGKRHKASLAIASLKLARDQNRQQNPVAHQHPPSAGPSATTNNFPTCDQCGKRVPSTYFDLHIKQHTRKKLFADVLAISAEAEEDKNGVSVSHKEGIDFGVVEPEYSVYIDITVIKRGAQSGIALESFTVRKAHESDLTFSVSLAGKSKWVKQNRTRTLTVKFHPSFEGEYEDVLELIFWNTATRTSIYHNPQNSRRFLRPPNWGPIQWTSRLPEFKPPKKLIQAAFTESGMNAKAALQNVKRFMPATLTIKTYAEHFQVLLHIEEEQMRQDLELYNLTDVELKPNHPRYDLQVKGLEEGRPSVIVGDYILVRHTGVEEGPWYEGRVHHGTKFDVRFTLNRLPHRRMHQALINSFKPRQILFPGITPVNRQIAEDPEQLETVAAILHQPPGSVPFIVFGPPGTGKTVTIVEAIRQILLRDPDARILACAPSNSAADLIAMNLSSIGTLELFRLNALSRKYKDLPKNLQRFSAVNDNLTFVLPVVEDLRKFRVVVSTCLSGGVPAHLGVERGHFSHIFVDEAGQATEPEVILPIKSNAGPKTNVILAGDNKQLGPIIQSWMARSLGLQVSYLSRIMQRDIYSLDPETSIVKLVNNFRSHPAILEFSNQQFYDGELQSCGNPALIRSLENSDELPTKKFPLIFHGVVTSEDREGSSPSYFNAGEASLVKKYVSALVGNRKLRVRPEEIGVITPYHAQRCKIIDLLSRDPKFRGITVGSVEEFQGQERRVIIMSTVRSNTNYVESDIRKSLGFVANHQRFNVAITRAQALLIVIGNPDILALDPMWRGFLNYIHTRGGWRGKQIAWNPEDPVAPGPDGYDGEMRRRAEGEAEETITRIRALISQRCDSSELDFELSDGDLELGPDGATGRDAE